MQASHLRHGVYHLTISSIPQGLRVLCKAHLPAQQPLRTGISPRPARVVRRPGRVHQVCLLLLLAPSPTEDRLSQTGEQPEPMAPRSSLRLSALSRLPLPPRLPHSPIFLAVDPAPPKAYQCKHCNSIYHNRATTKATGINSTLCLSSRVHHPQARQQARIRNEDGGERKDTRLKMMMADRRRLQRWRHLRSSSTTSRHG